MMKHLFALLVPVAAVFALLPAGADDSKGMDFSYTSTRGTAVDIKNDRGHVVVLLFWATFSKPSRDAASALVKAHHQYHDDLVVYGINMDADQKTMETYADEYEMNWPEYWDGKGPDSDAVKAMHISGGYGLFVIDRGGHIVAENPADISGAIAKAIASK